MTSINMPNRAVTVVGKHRSAVIYLDVIMCIFCTLKCDFCISLKLLLEIAYDTLLDISGLM